MNPQVFLIIWFLIVITILLIFYTQGKKALAIFPPLNTVNVIYRDKSASGRSLHSFKTKFGGARKVLDIVVTDNEIWLKSMLLFAFIQKRNDLLHKVKLDQIKSIKLEEKKVKLSFTSNGQNTDIELFTSNPLKLIDALKTVHNT